MCKFKIALIQDEWDLGNRAANVKKLKKRFVRLIMEELISYVFRKDSIRDITVLIILP